MKRPNVQNVQKIWKDRKRHFGLPLSFTRYSMSEDRFFVETGLFNLREEKTQLYRVKDVSLRRTLWQRLTRVGTICVKSSDATVSHLDIVNIAYPREVKELLNEKVEAAKKARRMRATEILEGPEDGDVEDADGDGIPDDYEG